jgi:hypothetical protein
VSALFWLLLARAVRVLEERHEGAGDSFAGQQLGECIALSTPEYACNTVDVRESR